MKFRSFLLVTGLSSWGWMLSAAPGPQPEKAGELPPRSVESWVRDLSNEQFGVRENATREIWKIGDQALPALQAAVAGDDPEAAYRARELVRKIELFLTPETDPEVMKLVERYAKASTDEKQDLLNQMHRKRAWRQILKLFASETNVELVKRIQGSIDKVAVIAARECLLNDDAEGAREYLEMAPANSAGLLALADFHRFQGTLDAELERALTLEGKNGDSWRLALYRASGDLEAARGAADAAGELTISATLSMLLGDPLPWMRLNLEDTEKDEVYKPYAELAIRHWQGEALGARELEPLTRALADRNANERKLAMNALFLLGESGLAEDAYSKLQPSVVFSYLESLERIPEALKSLGLDPDEPDFKGWVAERFASISSEMDQEDRMEMADANELVLMANFMDRRGMSSEFSSAFMMPLAALAEEDEDKFSKLLGMFFYRNGGFDGSPDLTKLAGYEWAGDSARRWDDLLDIAFGESEEVRTLWKWTAELDPEASRIDRFDGLLALMGMGTDPLELRDKWLELGWKAAEEKPDDQRGPVFEKISTAIALNPDVKNKLKLWDMVPEEDRDGFFRDPHISGLTIAGRWDEAAEFFLKQLAQIQKYKLNPSPRTHASAAACLRQAGRLEEAAVQDEWVEKLALGNDAYEIAIGYQYGDDFQRSAKWLERSVRQEDVSSGGLYDFTLEEHGERLLEAGRWQEAAAVFEVRALMVASKNSESDRAVYWLKLRLEADLARALSMLDEDRAGALALLERCFAMFPGDGTLADFFFPSLRMAGLIREHDAWFAKAWDRMSAVVADYPGSSNSLNTTGWLAAKSQRKLDEAEGLLERALAMKPYEYSYLDTMAEIAFGKGNREKAMEWSTRAVDNIPGDANDPSGQKVMLSFMLRRQREHFRRDPLPR